MIRKYNFIFLFCFSFRSRSFAFPSVCSFGLCVRGVDFQLPTLWSPAASLRHFKSLLCCAVVVGADIIIEMLANAQTCVYKASERASRILRLIFFPHFGATNKCECVRFLFVSTFIPKSKHSLWTTTTTGQHIHSRFACPLGCRKISFFRRLCDERITMTKSMSMLCDVERTKAI